MSLAEVTNAQVLRLVAAYGLEKGKPEPRERPPYVPYCVDCGVEEKALYVTAEVTAERIELLAPMWAKGWSYKRMSRESGLSFHTISGIVERNRGRFPNRYKKGKGRCRHTEGA